MLSSTPVLVNDKIFRQNIPAKFRFGNIPGPKILPSKELAVSKVMVY